jgi:hypothetical protein
MGYCRSSLFGATLTAQIGRPSPLLLRSGIVTARVRCWTLAEGAGSGLLWPVADVAASAANGRFRR